MRPALKFFYSFFQSEKGFSLTELLVVVGILGVLSAVAIPTYSKYKIGVLQTIQKSELVAVSRVLDHVHNVDGGYHQKIYAAGYRPSKVMKVNVGFRYNKTDPLCCSSHPQSATGDFSSYLTLSSDVYIAGKIDSSVSSSDICGHADGNCTEKGNQGRTKNSHLSPSGSDSNCATAFHNKAIECACNSFVVLSGTRPNPKSGGALYRAYINQDGLLCKGLSSTKSAPLKPF